MIIELHSTSKSSLSQNERRVILNSEKSTRLHHEAAELRGSQVAVQSQKEKNTILTVCSQQSDPIAQDNRVSQFDISTTFKYIKIIQQFSNHILNHRLKTGCIAILTR